MENVIAIVFVEQCVNQISISFNELNIPNVSHYKQSTLPFFIHYLAVPPFHSNQTGALRAEKPGSPAHKLSLKPVSIKSIGSDQTEHSD